MWWSEKTIDMFEGSSFRLSEYMSGRRFQNIGTLYATLILSRQPSLIGSTMCGRLLKVGMIIYEGEYVPTWLNCLDESMNSFLDKFYPDFMCVPRKPHPFGNKYHSIADGETEKGLDGKPIMWRVKIKEGKDLPKKTDGSWAFSSEFPGYSKTATLMLEIITRDWAEGWARTKS